MSLRTGLEKIVRLLVPPIVPRVISYLRSSGYRDYVLEYAPDFRNTPAAEDQNVGWNATNVADTERGKWEEFCRNVQGAGPLGFAHEHPDLSVTRFVPFHNVHITYAYVLALTAHRRDAISVLDWGGAIGHYYQIGRAVMPDIKIDFHCKEVARMVAVGRLLNPEVHWYADESCLERTYDLVMMNGSLQCSPDWEEVLTRVAKVAKGYFFLTRLPVVEESPSFAARQRVYGTEMIHMQLNQAEVLQAAERAGLKLFREVVVGDRPYVHGAPEQCELRGWIFKAPEASAH
jgi:putative methyltransferase (TIGR04325 family)